MSFNVKFTANEAFKPVFNGGEEFQAGFSPHIVVPIADYYDGDYEITPAAEAQAIPIIGKTARHNITVGAIPNNYGLITWNGSTLTVS